MTRKLLIAAATIATVMTGVCKADLAPLKVSGSNLTSGGKPVSLRGINWGWWHLKNTQYTEADMQAQAGWGANVARLAFTYSDLEDPNNLGKIRDDGWKNFTDIFDWAKKYNQYVILDMHVVPGGQDTQGYCDGGHNLIWRDADDQRRFISLWTEIAKRCKNRPEVGAYEMLNEPCTQSSVPTKLVELCRRVIPAIRAIDPDKVIVMPGDDWSNAHNMVDDIKQDDPNILYTFHFYDARPPEKWISNATEGPGINGTQDWTRVTVDLPIPAGVSSMAPLLRSSNNSGTAWFDDLTITNWVAGVVQSSTFDTGPKPYRYERQPGTQILFDPAVGHAAPGSLKVSGTENYNGWTGPRIAVQGGRTFHMTAWIKLDNATGSTYLSVAYWGVKDNSANKSQMLKIMTPAAAFAKKYNVPVWVGEFGCEKNNLPDGLQTSWVRSCISAFEDYGFSWTYWNFHESNGPGSMALQSEHRDTGFPYPANDDLLAVLKAGWALNGKASN